MALLPTMLLTELADELDEDLFGRSSANFGLGLWPGELLDRPTPRAWRSWPVVHPRRRRHHPKPVKPAKSDGFQVCLDVLHFTPDEISVKTVDRTIIVEAKHEEREDEYGFVSRQFTRRYILPEGCYPEDVVSTLSSDGVLTIKAPKKEGTNVRVIPVQPVGPAHLTVGKEEGKETKTTGGQEKMAE